MKIIHLNEALSEMKKPEPFSITYVTCDQSRKTGGELMKLDKAMLSHNENLSGDFDFQINQTLITGNKKSARHYDNATRNLILPNGMKRKFHIRLILEFNGKKVFY